MYDSKLFSLNNLQRINSADIGMVLMIVAMFLLPIGDTVAKLLMDVISPLEITMWRFIIQSVFLMFVAFMLRSRLRGNMFSPIVALSGCLIAISVTTLISSFSAMPIATAIAIFFVEPLFLTLLAGILLKEKIGPRRLIAIGIGLMGALLVIRPSFVDFGFVAILPLVAGLAYALNMIVLRQASDKRSALTIQCGAAIYGSIIMIVLISVLSQLDIITPSMPSEFDSTWLLIIGAGGLAAITFVLIAEAFRLSEAAALAPFQYLEIIGATAAGYLVFGDFPDAITWLGISIILASGLYVFHREKKANQYRPIEAKARGEGAR